MRSTFGNYVHAMTKLLRFAGLLGIPITAAIMMCFGVGTDYYSPDRYEVAFATGFYVISVWAAYGFTCAVFFGIQTFHLWRSKRHTEKAEQNAAGQPATSPESK
jgi:hypothetical protein